MQKQNQLSGPSDRENHLELQGFMQHMQQKNASIERDLLLMEIARKLRLTDDLRFSYFFKSCENYQINPAYALVANYSYDEYIERLQVLTEDVVKDECRIIEIDALRNVLQAVHTLFSNYRFHELELALQDAFPECFSSNQNPLI